MTTRSYRRGSIRRLPSGRFQVRVSEGTNDFGRQRQLPLPGHGTFAKRTEAVKALDGYLAKRDTGVLTTPYDLTLGQWLAQSLSTRQGELAPSTYADYCFQQERHILPTLGRLKLQAFKPSHLRAFYADLAARGYSRSLLAQVRALISRGLEDAVLDELLSRNVARMVRLPPTRSAGKGRALTPEEIQSFLAQARHHVLGPMFEFALVTGLRRGELCALNWQHIDFDQAVLHITDNVPVVQGRPRRGTPKTEAGLRTMPLALETMTFLRLHQASQAQFCWQNPAQAPLFTTARGQRPHPDSVTKVMRQLALDSGLGRVTVHDLRHTHTSLRRRQNVPVEIVSRQVGHANVAFTLQRYRHTYSDEERAYTQGLTELLGPPMLRRHA